MIEQLTDDQEVELESYFQRLSRPTRRAGEEVAPEKLEAAVGEIYRELELPAPVIVLCDSPWQMAVSEAIASLSLASPEIEPESFLRELREHLKSPLWLRCLDRLEEHPDLFEKHERRAHSSLASIKLLRASLFGKSTGPPMRFVIGKLMSDEEAGARDSQLSVRVKLKLRETLRTRLGRTFPELTGFRFMRQLAIEIPDSLGDLFAREPLRSVLGGFEETDRTHVGTDSGQTPAGVYFSTFHPASLAADRVPDFPLFAFVNKNLGLSDDPDLVRKIDSWLTLFDAGFNWSGYERAIFLSRNPVEFALDEQNRLHCEDGPALSFKDGHAIYFIHGVVVPEAVVTEPASLTVEAIEAETNVEVRRIMIERFGLERYIEESGAVLIDSDDCGILYRKEQKLDEPLVVVKVVDSTSVVQGEPRHYFLRVPPYMRTARQAVAWTFNLSSGDYRPSEQT
ncbi:MAG: hypothetical protein KC777_24200 [Cyanobacteria bacterium HKST-UBA02]|nr:hypothetical protein [Cyanobacteria bacterium HKST-UBA02]